MPRVSVIIPIFGVEKYIERCVRSLFSQTLDDLEFIFINDCTKDNSMIILNRLIEEYRDQINNKHWTIIQEKMPINSGLPSVRKRGIELANGDYILHCDSDDWMDINMISEMWHLAILRDLDVVICDFFESSDHENKYFRGVGPDINTAFIDIFNSTYSWALWNKLFRRSLYGKKIVFPQANIGEDMTLTLQLLYFGRKIGHIGKPLYYYYKNPSSMTQTKTADQVIRNMYQWMENVKIVEAFFESTSEKHISNCLVYVKFLVKNSLLPIMNNRHYCHLWKDTFHEINFQVYFCPYIGFMSKFFYFLNYIGLFPFMNANK